MSGKPLPQSRIQEFLQTHPEELIRIYTYQDVAAWERAQELGYFTGSHGYDNDNLDYDFAYEWMRAQMAKRIPDFSGDLPMWAWPKRSSNKKRHKDPYVRITAMVPRKRILASCFHMWHHHLNNWFIPASEEEYQEFESIYPTNKAFGTDPVYQAHVERHWEKVFDLSPRSGYDLEIHGFLDTVQLCVDRIYLTEVVGYRPPHANATARDHTLVGNP